MGGIPILARRLKKTGLDGITLTVNSLILREYCKMTSGNRENFYLMLKSIRTISKIFKEKTTLNVVVTKINLNSINKILILSKKLGVKVKLLEMTNGRQFPELFVKFDDIKKRFSGNNIEYVNSCCPAKNCNLCKKLYPVVRISPDGKINNCIKNEVNEEDILKFIKSRKESYIKSAILNCLNTKKEEK